MIFLLRGRARVRWGERLEFRAEAEAGDFVFVPLAAPYQVANANPHLALEYILVGGREEPAELDVDPVPYASAEAVRWSDPAPDPDPEPEEPADLDVLIPTRYWRFLHESGAVSAEAVRLLEGGGIEGYRHENESSWTMTEDGHLAFLTSGGRTSTVFDEVEPTRHGVRLSGRHLLTEAGPVLSLESLPANAEPMAPAPTRAALKPYVDRYGWAIGAYTYGVPDVVDPELGSLEIGRFCSIAAGVTIVLSNHNLRFASTFPFATLSFGWFAQLAGVEDHVTRGKTAIGNDVWIGKSAFIMSGVVIGDGAVIAANAVVTKPVPPYAIAAGNPARIVGYRFPPAIIERLQRLEWWDWPRQKLGRLLPLMMSEAIEAFLDTAEAERPGAGKPGLPGVERMATSAHGPNRTQEPV